jgi:hypothetical protein
LIPRHDSLHPKLFERPKFHEPKGFSIESFNFLSGVFKEKAKRYKFNKGLKGLVQRVDRLGLGV